MPSRKRKSYPYRSKSRYWAKKKKRASVYQSPSPYNRVGSNNVVGLPTGMRVRMKYSSRPALTSGVTNQVENIYRAFSIFDPDLSGVGHQPLGHDQWATLYSRYRVLGSKIEVKFTRTDAPTAGTIQNQCCVALMQTSSLVADSETLIEQPICNYITLGNDGESKTVSLAYSSAWKTKGEPGVATESDYSASFGANPTRDAFYHVLAQAGGGTTVSVRANILITYDVWIYDPIDLAAS